MRTSDGTALARQDYRPRNIDVTIPAGARRVFVGVGTIVDGRNEPPETMTMTVVNAPGATVRDNAAVGTITS